MVGPTLRFQMRHLSDKHDNLSKNLVSFCRITIIMIFLGWTAVEQKFLRQRFILNGGNKGDY